MQDVSKGEHRLHKIDQSSEDSRASENSGDDEIYGKFGHQLRLKRNNCPLCNFVQNEMEKGNSIPVEEWIYLAHLRNAHGIEP